jgi:hypothetical protein
MRLRDIAQRIELRPNRHGGEVTCDLTIHPLFAREHLALDILEPGIWIRTLCSRFGQSAPTWYVRNDSGIQQMVDSIASAGLPWFDANATAEGIIQSATEFAEPWRNEQFVHVDLGHCYLRVGRFTEALHVDLDCSWRHCSNRGSALDLDRFLYCRLTHQRGRTMR